MGSSPLTLEPFPKTVTQKITRVEKTRRPKWRSKKLALNLHCGSVPSSGHHENKNMTTSKSSFSSSPKHGGRSVPSMMCLEENDFQQWWSILQQKTNSRSSPRVLHSFSIELMIRVQYVIEPFQAPTWSESNALKTCRLVKHTIKIKKTHLHYPHWSCKSSWWRWFGETSKG